MCQTPIMIAMRWLSDHDRMRTGMRIVRAAVVFLTLAVPQWIPAFPSKVIMILGSYVHRVAMVVLGAMIDDRLTTLVGVRDRPPVAQPP
jgi:hypothetical protein